ncbi:MULTISPECIES: tRNA preQ1(34) S-adenosylmethionine ribosyltransferase-isomerase QueA [unclassified Gemella]|uniref:tRNA preQ1(34) S-adenosylmethionine ribosyltransferase-isomerase QueA n=1 Tax=unclassified Gemella TaxID=2624949 RepID=UPI00107316A7|nr:MULTISPECIES: tRNA preQ1(34) S-adenosylmethionine ribosyltransferase-isomerase QueA [unclassified Gemella]MBF0710082.1 tRNA preQ1(34) S-adenosylmethionine ribosyltransferase-isomerase QueA [Gemella sp. GL1.1]MBF0746161.1 tRNA preQ1(34) S-adenosylmethionine ribosyltransferase-isomerase QueA [Gemella sp. 19428wG2_WT2a]NYS27426.1 tRNA preQ1(34) S-adenosylmethionine ribosyltransferase-isomerase QueA [Gemella sp. GL1]TFU60446.1 tRNA preQ1(34) S-adenosylmethionine ribosyltransferase-isomerase QueA
MKLEDFDFYLPENLIAQTPLLKRDTSKLLVINRTRDNYEHKSFFDILEYLNKGDTLVLNNTRVMPARLIGEKQDTKASIEVLLLKNIEDNLWECLVKPARRVKVGTILNFSNIMQAECIESKEDGFRYFKFKYTGIFQERLDELGTIPLPPYIKQSLGDKERYQTVYSKAVGSSAAPTAGLHFTEKLLKKINDKGVNIAYVTLHVGLGTFRPVVVSDIENHKMHSEYYEIDEEAANLINETKKLGKRVISVGTTSARTLETVASNNSGKIKKESGWSNIFIYPGYKFKCVDALITNFHLPKSSLIMLVSAFYTRENMLELYGLAVKKGYRFFSFGDAMFIY